MHFGHLLLGLEAVLGALHSPPGRKTVHLAFAAYSLVLLLSMSN